MASGDKNYDIAKQSTLTTSVGSSESEIINTSLFGKINNLINTLATHVANWTSARAEKIDTIATDSASAKADAADIKTTIGATGDTGGSASAGSVMAKLNNIRSYVATTTTSSKTGTLSTKLNYLINNIDFSGTGKGTTIYSKTTSTTVGTSSYAGGHKCHAKFIAPVEGWYTITLTNSSSTSTRQILANIFTNVMPYCYYDVDSTHDHLTHVQIHKHAWNLYNGTTVLGTLTYEGGTTTYEQYDGPIKEVGISRTVGTVTSGETKTFYFYLFKGAPCLVNLACPGAGSDTGTISSYSISYGNS